MKSLPVPLLVFDNRMPSLLEHGVYAQLIWDDETAVTVPGMAGMPVGSMPSMNIMSAMSAVPAVLIVRLLAKRRVAVISSVPDHIEPEATIPAIDVVLVMMIPRRRRDGIGGGMMVASCSGSPGRFAAEIKRGRHV